MLDVGRFSAAVGRGQDVVGLCPSCGETEAVAVGEVECIWELQGESPEARPGPGRQGEEGPVFGRWARRGGSSQARRHRSGTPTAAPPSEPRSGLALGHGCILENCLAL